ncbi:MAG: Holliday junction resolvase RuvX [Lysobacterales bacterium]|jgi:putative Holliday junction resolvase
MAGTRAADGCILGFDFGVRRIGVAVGQRTTRTASSLETVSNGRDPDWDALDRLVRDWRPRQLLVGLPVNAEGEETDMSRAARRFGESLRERYGLDVSYADERLSSRAAEGRFAELRASGTLRRKHARRLDAMAAQIILESWLESHSV